MVVLDDSDQDFVEARPHHDTLRFLTASGRELGPLKEFNTSESVSAAHAVAIDAARGRIYVCELNTDRVTALDIRRRKLWQVKKLKAMALAVDPKTGHVWCTGGPDPGNGETVVLDTDGNEVDSFPFAGIDIAYDPHTDGCWLVGYRITKLSRQGDVLFQKPHEGWLCVSVAVNPRDGTVWVAERGDPQIPQSANRIWHLDPQGRVLWSKELATKMPWAVACDGTSGTAYLVNVFSELLRFTPDGNELPPLAFPANAVAVSPTTGDIWLTTKKEVLRLDKTGAIQSSSPLGAYSGQSRLAAF